MKTLNKTTKGLLLLAPVTALGIVALTGLPAQAATASTTYSASLTALNHATGSGNITITLDGSTATVDETFAGLAATFNNAPYPHVQHIHGPDAALGAGGVGQCPTASTDKNADDVVSTTEGQPAYGPILSTLSTTGDTSPKAATTLTVAPSGANTHYQRSFTLDAPTMAALAAGKAVVVVHGLDPATLSKTAQGEKSDIVPSLPLAATSPALCGVLTASQMTTMPTGSSPTGGGSTAGLQDEALLGAGAALVLAAGGAFAARRRFGRDS